MAELGDRIKYLREKKGLTQEELAIKSLLTIVQISRYESNVRKPDPDALKRLTDNLDTSSDFLLGISNDPSPSSNKESSRAYYGGIGNVTEEEQEIADAAAKLAIETFRRGRQKGK